MFPFRMRHCPSWLKALIATGASLLALSASAAPDNFTRGVNTELIFTYRNAQNTCVIDDRERSQEDMFPSQSQLQTWRSAGFDHLRLPLDFHFLSANGGATLHTQNLARLKKYLREQVMPSGMNVIIDLHRALYACEPEDGAGDYAYSQFLESKNAGSDDSKLIERRNTFNQFWKNLAQNLSAEFAPQRMMFEPMNEPRFLDKGGDWLTVQDTLVAGIRQVAPNHRVIMTGSCWSAPDALYGNPNGEDCGALPILNPRYQNAVLDDKIVYNFHMYRPFIFSHQGAAWLTPYNQLFRIPFRPTPENMTPVFNWLNTNRGWLQEADRLEAELQAYLRDYSAHLPGGSGCNSSPWDPSVDYSSLVNDEMCGMLQKIQQWAGAHGIDSKQIMVTEFGAFPDNIQQGDYLTYTATVRKLLENYGAGWSLYYSQSYAPRTEVACWSADPSGENWITLRKDVQCALGLNTCAENLPGDGGEGGGGGGSDVPLEYTNRCDGFTW